MLDIVKSLTDLMNIAELSPQAQQMAPTAKTPEALLQVLGKEKLAPDAVNVLAHGMPEQKSVFWACKSTDLVSGQVSPEDMAAKMAAEKWVKAPTLANQTAAAEAAAKTDFQGPGAWAAQGAAWAKTPAPAQPDPAAAGLPDDAIEAMDMARQQTSTGKAVAGSVNIAAAMKNDPAIMNKISAPAIPQFKAPAIPGLEAPAFPDLKLPALPDLKMPAVPAPAAPQVPAMTPKELDATSKALDPFLKLGMDIAQGKISWT